MADLVDPRTTSQSHILFQIDGQSTVVTFDRKQLSRGSKFFENASSDKNGNTFVLLPGRSTSLPAIRTYAEYVNSLRIRGGNYANIPSVGLEQYSILISLYLLGEHVKDRSLQDDAMDALLGRYQEGEPDGQAWLPSREMLSKVHDNTTANSPLRKFLVDVDIWANKPGPKAERTHSVFLRDLFTALVAQRADSDSGVLYEAVAAWLDGSQPLKPLLTQKPKPKLGLHAVQVSPKIPPGVSCCDYHQHEAEAMCGNKKRKRERDEEVERVAKR